MSDDIQEEVLNTEASNAKCRNCGGNLTFDPDTQKLSCLNCDSKFDFSKKLDDEKHPIKDGKIDDDKSLRDAWAKEMKIVRCQTCGAEIMITGSELSTVCPYCGSDYVTEEKTLPGLKPDNVVPFKFSQNKAGDMFLKGIKKKFFAPHSLKKKLPASKIHGIYVPTFTFDADTFSKYDGVLEKTYTTRDSKGNSHTQTKIIHISGTKELEHRNYLIESSSKIDGKQMDALLPYTFDESYKYDENFVRGFSIEHYVDDVNDCHKMAKSAIDERIKKFILAEYDYTSVSRLNVDTKYSNEAYSYRMLPIYSFEFDWKNKKYMVLMNGQSGKVGSGYPKSKLKIGILIAIAVLLIAGLFVLAYFNQGK